MRHSERISLVFHGTEDSDTHESRLEVYKNANNELTVKISSSITGNERHVSLTKGAASKLVHELKSQISKITNKGFGYV